jgi:hypothetical protein
MFEVGMDAHALKNILVRWIPGDVLRVLLAALKYAPEGSVGIEIAACHRGLGTETPGGMLAKGFFAMLTYHWSTLHVDVYVSADLERLNDRITEFTWLKDRGSSLEQCDGGEMLPTDPPRRLGGVWEEDWIQ